MDAVLQQWLLNLAIDFPVPFRCLPLVLDGDERQTTPLNVKPLRGFTLQDGVRRLAELADAGLIGFAKQTAQNESQAVAPSEVLSSIAHADDSEILSSLSFGLTQAGGETWESVAEPCWFGMESGSATPRYAHDDCERGRLMGWDWTQFSQDQERLMASVAWWFAEHHEEQVDFETVEVKLAEDYKVRYWKRLPNVYVATFQTSAMAPRTPVWPRGLEPKWFTEWRIARSAWYRQPWEMDGWPPTPDK